MNRMNGRTCSLSIVLEHLSDLQLLHRAVDLLVAAQANLLLLLLRNTLLREVLDRLSAPRFQRGDRVLKLLALRNGLGESDFARADGVLLEEERAVLLRTVLHHDCIEVDEWFIRIDPRGLVL